MIKSFVDFGGNTWVCVNGSFYANDGCGTLLFCACMKSGLPEVRDGELVVGDVDYIEDEGTVVIINHLLGTSFNQEGREL